MQQATYNQGISVAHLSPQSLSSSPAQAQIQPGQMQMQQQPQVQYIQIPPGQLPPGVQYIQQPQPAQGQPIQHAQAQAPVQLQPAPQPQMKQMPQPVYVTPGLPSYNQHQVMQQMPITQQPTVVHGMQLATSAMQPYPTDQTPRAKRPWSFDLCSSQVISGCFLPWCCPCITYGQNEQRIAALKAGKAGASTSACNLPCVTFCVAVWCIANFASMIMVPLQRSALANDHDIDMSCVSDIVCSCVCVGCVLSQTSEELTVLERQARGY
ncbi:uncharacterized protein L969DRAFT_52085 [Mixia osmundae IAM 14324]|uniref:PLAC8 family protein n=1 Tax=Mixia osmundae (strain CBS 9802 / IAM 14324 / JCM 22182 / KY 12970) TaxID=764103 RepID=G7DSJ1_MIXOS|nr:uncharacterized protein L969DRAFT_52085 [Mixia osmundae IAM 14324]KEI37951.1 hypothetical protein L969DRAFT_52085 [Mixia osmundae IAM 14324]GAA93551.1 hypothetical protein E5Q_00195 [Mixia osmundae IAM 14324]